MTTRRLSLVVALLAFAGGCTDFCVGDEAVEMTFARRAAFEDQMALCVHDHRCIPLCEDVFQIDGQVKACEIVSVMRADQTTGPLSPSADVTTLRGANLRVTFVPRVACSAANNTDWNGGEGDWDGGSTDDGGDDGSCDDGSCSGDDGNGGGDDGGGDDGGGDGGGGDDGGGDDGGDALRAPGAITAHAVHAATAR